MATVRFEAVTKRFNEGSSEEVVAVNDLNLEIHDGELLVLVGPSGCGKSTSLRMIAGLERPTSGRIYIGSEDVTTLHPRARNIAMVFQDYALYPHMSVRENLSFGLKNLKYPKDEINRRVQEASALLGIGNLLERQPRQLSGGQRQRVALGRAIVRNPAVFLLDEPLSNLDAKLRVQMRVELAELQRRIETTMVYVTHDQEEAMTLGHRIVVMHDGVVRQVADPETLYHAPEDLFVAGFIGSPPMNLIRGRFEPRDGGLRFAATGAELALPPAWARTFAPFQGKEMVIGIRPESMKLAGQGPSDDDLEVEAEVKAVEMIGAYKLIYFDLGDRLLVGAVPGEERIQAPQRVMLHWKLGAISLFDAETERRVPLGTEEGAAWIRA